jgi:magnesium-transporting ATPase (P-type)
MIKSVGNVKRFGEIKDKIRVMARCSPEDKYLLTTGL